jgi:hypothetical protein
MRNLFAIALAVACAAFAASASAQVVPPIPDLQARIPAPLPPPPMPPTINGPMGEGPSPGMIAPAPLTTFSDRVGQCLQVGGSGGLSGFDLSTYVGACANFN